MHNKSITERNLESSKKYLERAKERFRLKVTDETDHIILQKQRSGKKKTQIRQQTRKEAGIKSELSKLKTSIELEAVQDNEYYCKGCGCSKIGLDKSHILSVGQYKQYELIRANIQLMCRECHQIWESGTIQQQIKLHCFVDNLQFIYTLEPLVHQKFITRIEEYRMWLIEDQDKLKIHVIDQILDQVRA